MPVTKYRSVAEMPRPARVSAPDALLARMRAVWSRAARLAPPPPVRRGVTRFRTMEEANRSREEHTLERMRQTRPR